MKINTITLNPVYDVMIRVPNFRPFGENVAASRAVFSGGKGINVSRALLSSGFGRITGPAFLLLGEENGRALENDLRAFGLDVRACYVPGRTRENLTFVSDGLPETRVSSNDFSAESSDLQRLLTEIRSIAEPDDILVMSGKTPKGLSDGDRLGFFRELTRLTPCVALDSGSFSAEEIHRLRPWIIKPNEEELDALIGAPCPTLPDRIAAVSSLCREGLPNVLLSLGGDGAIYGGEKGFFRVSVPRIKPVSTVGSGDSLLAGLTSAFAEGLTIEEALTRACAFGTACCLEPGPNPPKPDAIARIARDVTVTAIAR